MSTHTIYSKDVIDDYCKGYFTEDICKKHKISKYQLYKIIKITECPFRRPKNAFQYIYEELPVSTPKSNNEEENLENVDLNFFIQKRFALNK